MTNVAWYRFTLLYWAGMMLYARQNEDPSRFWNLQLPEEILGPSRKPRELVENGPKRIYTYPKEVL